jgi:hypothetical protein
MRLKGVWVSGGSTTGGEAPPQPRVIDGWAVDMKEAAATTKLEMGDAEPCGTHMAAARAPTKV